MHPSYFCKCTNFSALPVGELAAERRTRHEERAEQRRKKYLSSSNKTAST